MLYQGLLAVAEQCTLCLYLLVACPRAPSSSSSNAPGPWRGEDNNRLAFATDRQAILNAGTAVGSRQLEVCWHGRGTAVSPVD